MNRAEFMAALEAQLRDITTEERDEALKFYNEYLDEAGPENEAAVLAELGSPQKVACIIRANCGFGVPAVRDAAEKSTAPEKPEQAPVPELTLDGPDWQASQAPAQETERSWAEGQRADEEAPDGFPNAQAADGAQHGPAYAYSYPQDGAHRENGGRSASNRTLWVILLILTCPIWIGLIGGLFGGVVGIVGGLCGIAFAGFATMIAGVAAFGGGVGLLFTSVPSGILTMGLSLLCISIGALLGAGTVWVVAKAGPALFRAVGSLCRTLFGKVREDGNDKIHKNTAEHCGRLPCIGHHTLYRGPVPGRTAYQYPRRLGQRPPCLLHRRFYRR